MNPKDAAQFKKLLLARRTELTRGQTAPAPAEPAEVDEANLAPAPAETVPAPPPANALLHALDGALSRIDKGTYGTCTSCGQEIGTRRLVAFPWATHCLPCQAKASKQS